MALGPKEQEQEAMSKRDHPYKKFEKDELWRVLNKGIGALAKNGDLEEKTARTHVVGYLVKLLRETSALNGAHAAKHTRVIEVKPDEELVVRAG